MSDDVKVTDLSAFFSCANGVRDAHLWDEEP